MAKGKVQSTKSGNWGSFGGSQHMYPFTGTGKQHSGVSSQEGMEKKRGTSKPYHAQGGGANAGFYSTGATNTDYAGTSKPGVGAPTKEGPNNKFAQGGKTHMHSNTGSRRAIAGQSSQ